MNLKGPRLGDQRSRADVVDLSPPCCGEALLCATFLIPAPAHGKAMPYGVYDLYRNEGWVRVGIDHDTASSAANAMRR
jgi:hypothetical protein